MNLEIVCLLDFHSDVNLFQAFVHGENYLSLILSQCLSSAALSFEVGQEAVAARKDFFLKLRWKMEVVCLVAQGLHLQIVFSKLLLQYQFSSVPLSIHTR